MQAYLTLPDGYRQFFLIDLKANRRQNLIVNGLALLLAVIAFIPAYAARPFPLSGFNVLEYLPQYFAFMLGLIAYLVLHEAVHGVCFWHFSRVKPTFGASREFFYAASSAYFPRRVYLIIALAPVVLWGAVLAVICAVVPPAWFWAVMAIQLSNISGAGGDLYVSWKLSRMPADLLVLDEGIRMTVYVPEQA